jgi:hypothetical protein
MSFTVLLHISGEATIACEMEELPKPTDNFVTVLNPRQKDGKDLHFIDHGTAKVIWPIVKISFIEIMGDSEDEKIIGFVRE